MSAENDSWLEQDGGVIALRLPDGTVRRYKSICPHQDAPLQRADGHILYRNGNVMCAQHSAIFDAKTGLCSWGPCKGATLQPA